MTVMTVSFAIASWGCTAIYREGSKIITKQSATVCDAYVTRSVHLHMPLCWIRRDGVALLLRDSLKIELQDQNRYFGVSDWGPCAVVLMIMITADLMT
jgi:hypothetical protein